MADNRIYLRCKACGETLFLGKRSGGGYFYNGYGAPPLEERLNEFYDKHEWCNDHGLDCFEIEYEIEPEF